jgi:hypothetical protein
LDFSGTEISSEFAFKNAITSAAFDDELFFMPVPNSSFFY